LFLPEFKRLVVTNGTGHSSEMFNADSFTRLQRLPLLADADNVRYDATTQQIYIGYGHGALGMVAATDGRRLGDIPLAGHPESFQLEPSGPRIFVNVPAANQIAVVHRDTRAVMSTWPTPGARDNFPMALDDAHQRLVVGFRQPAQLIVFDTVSGQPVARVESAGDADDVFYDAARQRIYVSGGDGILSVFAQLDADHYIPVARISTAPGARTSLFVPEFHRLYLAVPHRGTQTAEIRVYDVQP
jgi:hypothetical protein